MLMDPGYAIWGGALVVLLALLVGGYLINGIKRVQQLLCVQPSCDHEMASQPDVQRNIENRALMFLVNQKTDSMLAALSEAIEKERQKLGVIVRNPSIIEEIDTGEASDPAPCERPQSSRQQILSMADNGKSIDTIARQLDLSEAEVSLVMRLNAA